MPPAKRECTFCQIVRHEVSSQVVFEDDACLAFMDHRPLLRGHCLLVPRTHYETLIDLPAAEIAPLFANVQLLARALEIALKSDGSFVAINNRISQSVPHLHVHVVPRWKKDGLFSKSFIWRRQPYADDNEIIEVRDTIRAAIGRHWKMTEAESS